jgi:hypothetical protein
MKNKPIPYSKTLLGTCCLLGLGCPKQAFAKIATPRKAKVYIRILCLYFELDPHHDMRLQVYTEGLIA